jgi:hypothetical protein
MRIRARSWGIALLVSLSGCGGSGAEAEADQGGGSQANESGGGEAGFPEPDACGASEDCSGEFCVAAWSGQPPRGPAICVAECVEAFDLQRFCIDDAACCEGLDCSIDGLCEPPWTGDGDGDPGDGDGDPGDGDGDPGDGDGDPGDGDGDPGDGDGDPGDGDGDPGDGDGDPGDGDGDPGDP